MPDPTSATYRLFSWMRQGLFTGFTNAAGAANTCVPGHLVLPIRLRINNTGNGNSKSIGADAVARDVFIIGVRPLISAATTLVRTRREWQRPRIVCIADNDLPGLNSKPFFPPGE